MATTQTNQQYSLNMRDLLRGLLIAVITAVLTAMLDALNLGGINNLNWETIGVVGLTAGVSYLVKNYFTPTEIVVIKPPEKAVTAVKEGASVQVGTTTIPSNPAA